VGRTRDALLFAQRALVLATQLKNDELAALVRAKIARYESQLK